MVRFSRFLIPLYAVATLFPRLLALPSPFGQVQLTEIIFLLALWFFRGQILAEVRRFPRFTGACTIYLLANFSAAIWAGNAGAMLEAGARAYLVVLVFIVVAHLRLFGDRALISYWKWATVGIAALTVVGYGFIVLGGANLFSITSYFVEYPYLGSLYRLRGSAQTYGMFYTLLLPGMWWAFRDWRGGSAIWPFLIVMVAGVLTFGKENLLFPAGLFAYEAAQHARRSVPLWMAAALTVALLLFGTHLLIERVGAELTEQGYTAGAPVATLGQYTLSETNYTANKRAALLIGWRHPWVGVGPGRFSSHTEALVVTGNYPAHFGRFDPHSAWTGAFAETGLFGLLGFFLIVLSLVHYRPEGLPVVVVVLLLFLVASVFKDVMNFRGVWVLIGVYLATCSSRGTPAASITPDGRHVISLTPWTP